MDNLPKNAPNSYLYIGETLNPELLNQVEDFICFKGGKVYQVTTHAEARAIIENNNINAIVVDQYLDTWSGIDFMRWAQSFAVIPTLVVIMHQSVNDIEAVIALEAGATDTVRKDISARELAARIKASIRKYYFSAESDPVASGPGMETVDIHMPKRKRPVYFTPATKRLYFSDSSRINLHGKEADLLNLLVRNFPDYLGREEISQKVFNKEWNPSDRSIDNLISRLRKIIDLSEYEGADSFIETVRNEGYRLRIPILLLSAEQQALSADPAVHHVAPE